MYEEFYRKMYKIRNFEETLLKLFSENKLTGTTHTGIGQEAVAVSVMNNVTDSDYVFSNHRCHGHFIAYSDNVEILLAEIMGKEEGVCKGRGGSQHLCYKKFYTNGIQGGIVPNATGIAWAEKLKKSKGMAVVFIGDGTLGQGIVYESFNMASLYSIPILYIVEDNAYAMTTRNTEGVAGQIVDRAKAFNIQNSEIESNDVVSLDNELKNAFEYVRNTGKPFCQVIHTYRLGPHSKGDDFRDEQEVAEHRAKDPLVLLENKNVVSNIEEIKHQVKEELEAAIRKCEGYSSYIDDKDFCEDIENAYIEESILNEENSKCVVKLNDGLKEVMKEHQNALLIGEDIKDPYGGAFKVTKGISPLYPERVIGTPISEAGFIGLGVGLALNGYKPIVEMMFGDFITLGFDQLLNHATKYHWMYAGQVNVPLLIRVPMGGGRGYGATHSQTLEKFYVGIPNLQIIALSPIHDPHKLICRIEDNIKSPTMIIENKKMYGEKLYAASNGRINDFIIEEEQKLYPIIKMTYDDESTADAVIITYGATTSIAMKVVEKFLMEDELQVDIIVNTMISPIDYEALAKKVGKVKKICTLEEGTKRGGWGAEVIAGLSEITKGKEFIREAALDCVIPAGSDLEKQMLPDETKLYSKLKRWLENE